MPRFHHVHINAVDPNKNLDWYAQYWPQGKKTTWAGFPAFSDEKGFYLLYNKVGSQPAGAFDRKAQGSVPQSAFWTFGQSFKGPDTKALRERIAQLPNQKDWQMVTLYGGPDGTMTATHAAALPMGDQLLTFAAMRERAEREKTTPPAGPPSQQLDFGYYVDPAGVLVEFTAGQQDTLWAHSHFWHEQPLCAANWYVENLGFEFSPQRDPATREMKPRTTKYEPCDVPIGDVSYPTYMAKGQLRIPVSTYQLVGGGFSTYTRQCRNGRCGPGNDKPLVKSKGQVVDHIALSYPNLDQVIAHLRDKGVKILEGPHKLGDTRAIMIEDLDGLSIELLEARN
jgi:catechol 2,3-dioxygenase-like lactoylglutathione lyase family enzyme